MDNMDQSERLKYLIKYLLNENPKYNDIQIPDNYGDAFRLFRSLVNVRMPQEISDEFLAVQDEFLREETAKKGITDITDLQETEKGIYLWQGDITTLKCGGIVNAANSQMLGCFNPCHSCIDNAIHTFAGVQLRLECDRLMKAQGHEEDTGLAKVTNAYNLPCNYVIHTVGPIVRGRLNDRHRALLESCYISCLEAAVKHNIDSIAFCCISTGVFAFPNKDAAEIAVRTVREFPHKDKVKVIFNVFSQTDYEIYRKLLG
jgi:O-acetyl-ADP-ribose deacetylase (regulator of RNase III)